MTRSRLNMPNDSATCFDRLLIVIGQAKKSISFVEREMRKTLTASEIEFTKEDLLKRAREMLALSKELQESLGVSDDDLTEFWNIGLILSNRSATSPKPPSLN